MSSYTHFHLGADSECFQFSEIHVMCCDFNSNNDAHLQFLVEKNIAMLLWKNILVFYSNNLLSVILSFVFIFFEGINDRWSFCFKTRQYVTHRFKQNQPLLSVLLKRTQ